MPNSTKIACIGVVMAHNIMSVDEPGHSLDDLILLWNECNTDLHVGVLYV